MRLIHYDDLATFSARAEPFLLAREAEHCLAIGILTTLRRSETTRTTPLYFALVEDGRGEVVEAAVATPPRNLILSHIGQLGAGSQAAAEIIRLVAENVREALPNLPGVHGPNDLARLFAGQWQRLTGQGARVDAHERIYRLTHLRPQRQVPGEMRRATEADRPLLREWLLAFWSEALGLLNHPQVHEDISRRLRFESSGMYLWQDAGAPVSLAGYGGPTPHGVRIGPVYTPPEARGHGYASALVAALSQLLLDEGRQSVFLFTNLANPTSNHIYQEIGYQAVGDIIEYLFQPAP
jgi:predicted GNAT family acetyltransferase